MEKAYHTTSLALAAWLVYSGVKLRGVLKDKKDNRRVFEFEWQDGLDELIESFFKGNALVNAENYFLVLKSLKSRIYDAEVNVERD
jgi:hypothetical protein